ncbi:Exocyst complex component EXO70A1 [Capsicum annuum]|nr:Exocyst complex component EXO70A1 [Capsicum annuum]
MKMGIHRKSGVDGDMLSERARIMRESLQKSQSITDNVVNILGSFDHRLSALETAMRPTQIRTHAIRTAHGNIDKTLKAAEVILSQFDISRQLWLKLEARYLDNQIVNDYPLSATLENEKEETNPEQKVHRIGRTWLLIRSWLFRIMIEKSMSLIRGCFTTKTNVAPKSQGSRETTHGNFFRGRRRSIGRDTRPSNQRQFGSTRAEVKILKGPHEDLESYLQAIDQLRNNIRFFSNNKSFKSSDGVLSHANSLLTKAISKLEEEFKQLLLSYSKPVEPDRLFECLPNSMRPSSSPGHQDSSGKSHLSNSNAEQNSAENAVYTPPTLIPPRILPLLHDLAQQMVQAGHQQQFVKIYRDTRSPVLEESLRNLGVEKLSKDDVQKMQWEVLEAKIGNWIHFMRIAVKLLFAAERKVCDQILEGFDSLNDQCFAEVTTASVAVLLSFGDAIAKSKRSPEKLFVLLDMYEIMRELHSEIESLFSGKACSEIRESAFGLTKQLAQTAQETFGDFEEAVEKDATKTAVSDGTVHPLTSYVINYVKFLFEKALQQILFVCKVAECFCFVWSEFSDALNLRNSEAVGIFILADEECSSESQFYQSTLKQLFQEFENGGDSNSQLATVTMRIMQALQTNLDGKSKQYKDAALTHLFLMNNIHYMVRSVRRSEAKDLLGDDWVQRHRRVVQQHANQYKRIAWAKILQCLSIQGLTSSGGSNNSGTVEGQNSSGVSRSTVKDRLKIFNMQFEELHQRQTQWAVPDTELRESLRLAVAEVLLPAYRSFIKRFGPLVDSGKNAQKYIRYSAEDLDRMLGEFFEGKTLNEPKR